MFYQFAFNRATVLIPPVVLSGWVFLLCKTSHNNDIQEQSVENDCIVLSFCRVITFFAEPFSGKFYTIFWELIEILGSQEEWNIVFVFQVKHFFALGYKDFRQKGHVKDWKHDVTFFRPFDNPITRAMGFSSPRSCIHFSCLNPYVMHLSDQDHYFEPNQQGRCVCNLICR
jgi:hypothetical protein